MQLITPTRGIHQGMVIFAQGNNGWFAGLDIHGKGNPTVEERLQILLTGNYFTPQYIISPGETDPTITATTDGIVRVTNHSYALLQLNPGVTFDADKPVADGSPYARRKEWRDTTNPDAPIIADRNIGTVTAPQSIWTITPGDWRGSVTHNDNSTSFETSHIAPRTVYAGVETLKDHLFEAAGDDDALLIHSGTGE